MTKQSGLAAGIVLFLCILACDSPPWSEVIVANESSSDVVVKLKLPSYSWFANPCVYSSEQWKSGHRLCSTESHVFEIGKDEEKWVTVNIPPGGAAEIERGRYPDLEENPEGFILVDRLEVQGVTGNHEWEGRRQIFQHFSKEGSELSYLWGKSPRYVYYYR